MARNVKYIEKEAKPIPFLEDWWRGEGEYGDVVCEHGDFERRKKKDKRMNSLEMRGKIEKFLKPVLKKALIV